jgi:hypothetical protein
LKRHINDIIWIQQEGGYNTNTILQLIDNSTSPYTYYRLNLNREGRLFLGKRQGTSGNWNMADIAEIN